MTGRIHRLHFILADTLGIAGVLEAARKVVSKASNVAISLFQCRRVFRHCHWRRSGQSCGEERLKVERRNKHGVSGLKGVVMNAMFNNDKMEDLVYLTSDAVYYRPSAGECSEFNILGYSGVSWEIE